MYPSRRTVLRTAALAAPALLMSQVRGAVRLGSDYLFTLGVASGDPSPDGAVLWTRLAPEPLAADGGMPRRAVELVWEVAADPLFETVVRAGRAVAHSEGAHSVHVEVAGLAADRPYHYRFRVGGQASPTGRLRTSPARGAQVDRLRFCFASCQKYEAGHYAAWRHLVDEDPDLILFLGDYIYEDAPTGNGVRRHLTPEPVDLAGYRARHASYKLDLTLQAAHAAAPWVATWDDHEVANDYGRDSERGYDPAAFLRRRRAAYQAYWEHMPLRAGSRPSGNGMRLFRTVDWGALARFQVIDDRQYRNSPPCQPAAAGGMPAPYAALVQDCPERRDVARSMLGRAQERWLLDELGRGGARWNMLAQQTLMTPFTIPQTADTPPLYAADRWAGFPGTRDRIFRRWVDAGTSNPMVLSGDVHAFLASDIRHPDRADGAPIAAEFVGGSVTSLNKRAAWKEEAARNRGIRFTDNAVRGYARVDMDRSGARIAFRGLEDARDPRSSAADLAVFTVAHGRSGIAESSILPRPSPVPQASAG